MRFSKRSDTSRWLIIIFSFFIVVLILSNTYSFFQIFKNEERSKMELWAKAQKKINSDDLNVDLELPFEIIQNPRIPIIVSINDSISLTANVEENIIIDSNKLKTYIEKLKSQNNPIITKLSETKTQYLYYGNSKLINQLKYYPIALLLIIFLFGTVVYNFYRATKMSTQNKLWAGMAKETAHQIGTPLSSLIGWLEILKLDNVEPTTITEIEKDITRLQTITDRFSKVGSEPVLEIKNIIAETKTTFDYLKDRSSKFLVFNFIAPNKELFVAINPALHSWTIENLIKNAIDAMKGKGKLTLSIEEKDNFVRIKVTDTGNGVLKSNFSKVFEPGFTTKRRGWGLGLSLTKRIVQEYHKGKIKIAHSEIGKGTTMQISYKKA
ncbi:HAMP domain-containing sensor histidine kinase [uncultured Flavobacterium sp.]|uniref:HAMP domain-containing sensor histidine kinase n=1 Tax=uncultured Flavobacterium sp. TaxID=165435 RepID=UPI0030CA48E3